MPFEAAPIVLAAEEEAELRRRVGAHRTPQRDAKRAQVVLLAAAGTSSARIARQVGMHESNVAKWRRQFLAERLEGLVDRPRAGRPRVYGHDERIKVAAPTATSSSAPRAAAPSAPTSGSSGARPETRSA